ncbi:MAG TPA: tRNA (adenosine(37)-N6)-threonylcarbamoyltransferase complex ATPase subunit type 1 TsaE, partial [Candidatus Gracilibacteria bacterium]|nr:tRNA (adenosine(37)-N6)-threonylcarbamoyltransferase complex ATPase subunit type 1 TsaE [Candidatus Gracilibacteria bacterium]
KANKSIMKVFRSRSPAETRQIAADLYKSQKKTVIITLRGDLGSGKTVFVKGFASMMGFSNKDIKSPTYTYVRRYRNKDGRTLFHLDLYRINELDDLMAHDLSEIFSQKAYCLIEWPERIAELIPGSAIDVSFEYAGEKSRRITINDRKSVKALTLNETRQLIRKYRMPINVWNHTRRVTALCIYLGKKIIQNGIKVDLDKLKKAALLHDLVKVCDFRSFTPSSFQQKVNAADLKVWKKIKKEYGEIGHARGAADVLQKSGQDDLASLVLKHDFYSPVSVEKQDRPQSYEEKILYYADKRIMHSNVVSIKQRLADFDHRYSAPHANNDSIVQIKRRMVARELYRFEKELCKAACLKPDQINNDTVGNFKF